MRAKKRRYDKKRNVRNDIRAIKKAIKSGEIQTDSVDDLMVDDQGRPIVNMLPEADVSTLGYADRDLSSDALNALGVTAREGLGLLPGVGEVLDAAEVAKAADTGKDFYGDEVDPKLLGALTAAGYLVPNIIERPVKKIGRAVSKALDTETAKKILDRGYDMYSRSFKDEDSIVENTKENLMRFVGSDDYIDRVVRSLIRNTTQAISKSGADTADNIRTAKEMQSKALKNISESTSDVVNSKEFMNEHYGDYFAEKGKTPPDFGGLAYRTTGGEPHPVKSRRNNPSIVLNRKANRSAAAHELGHVSLDENDIMNAARSVDTPKVTEEGKKLLQDSRYGEDYYGNPDEIRARAFEVIDAAYEIGVKPDDLVDFWLEATGPNASLKQYRSATESIPKGLVELIDYFDEKELRNYLNKVWGALPIVGAGAAAASRMGTGDEASTSYDKGGMIPVYKNGGKMRIKKRNYKEEYKKFHSGGVAKRKRAKLLKYNRDHGTDGNGDGLDAFHKGGKIVGFKSAASNRGSKVDSPGDRRARGGKK